MTDPTDISPDDPALAAEYALGLLSVEERASFEARLRTDTSLFALVTAWQSEFAALADVEVAPVPPPPALQTRIEAAVFGMPERSSLWSSVAIWRGLTLVGFATSVTLAALVAFAPLSTAPPQPAFVAQLAPVTGEAQFVAVYDAEAATLRVQQAGGVPAAGRAQELWLIAGDAAPISLGLLTDDATTVIALSQDLQAVLTQAVLAVSDEPLGGSPTGAPTGDVLAAGSIISL